MFRDNVGNFVQPCEDCPYKGRCVGPKGDPQAEIMAVGEAPGGTELARGVPFTGPSGELLDFCLEKAGLTDIPLFITNALSCRPPVTPVPNEPIRACHNRLVAEVELAPRKVIIALGNSALRSLTSNYDLKITNERGKIIRTPWGLVIPTLHPAAILRKRGDMPKLLGDFQYAADIFRNGEDGIKTPGDVEWNVVTEENVDRVIAGLQKYPVLAVDIETHTFNPRSGRILCVGISWEKNKAIIFPTNMVPALKPLFDNPHIKFVWHNGKYDTSFFKELYDMGVRVDEDTMLISYCVSPETRVLRSDLTWTTAGELQVNEELVSCDQAQTTRIIPGTVLETKRQTAFCYRIVTNEGSVVCSANHQWPVKTHNQTISVFRTTEWLADFVRRVNESRSSVNKKRPAFLMMFVGYDSKIKSVEIQRVEPVGITEVIGVTTDTGTFTAEGFLTHNSLNEMGGDHGLKDLASDLLGAPDYKEVVKKYAPKRTDSFAKIPKKHLYQYLARDADNTFQLFPLLRGRLDREPGPRWAYEHILIPASDLLRSVESAGLFIDLDEIRELKVSLEASCADEVREMYDICGMSFNPNSPKQLLGILHDQGVPVPNTREETLEPYKTSNAFVTQLAQYRKDVKSLGTYVNGILTRLEQDGRVHPTFKLHGTRCVTGDTFIWTDQGLLRADEICTQESGWESAHIGLLSMYGRDVATDTLVTQNQRTLEVNLGLGLSLKCTPEHPFMTDRGWVKASDLVVGNSVRTSFGANYFPLASSEYPPALLELAGLFLSDGHIHWDESAGHYSINISNRDSTVRDNVYQLAREVYGSAVNVSWDDTVGSVKIRGKEIVCQWKRWFPVNGATEKKVPDFVRSASRDAAISFIRGVSVDGTWSVVSAGKNKCKRLLIRMNSADRNRADIVQQFLLNLGIRCEVHQNVRKDEGRRRTGIAVFDKYWQVDIVGSDTSKFAQIIGPATSKQQGLLQTILDYEGKSWDRKNFKYDAEGCLYVQVLDVREGGYHTVYDFRVPNSHSFTAGALVVHNTGRLSCSNPNTQNITRGSTIKRIFGCPDGKVLAEIDLSQAELRVLAHLSGDDFLRQVYEEDRDMHAEMAAVLYPGWEQYRETTPLGYEQRVRAKFVNFGVCYGRGGKAIAEQFDLPVREGHRLVAAWLSRAPQARDYLEKCSTIAMRGGTLVSPFGRKRRFNLITREAIHEVKNEGRNFPIQSTTSDLALISAMRAYPRLQEMGVKIVNLVHDSILIEAPSDCVLEASAYIVSVMVETPRLTLKTEIPFKADVKVGKLWGDMHEIKNKDLPAVDTSNRSIFGGVSVVEQNELSLMAR